MLLLDEAAAGTLSINGETRLDNVDAGLHTLEISGIAPNCRLTNGPVSRNVTILSGGSQRIDLLVLCLEPDSGRILYATVSGNVHTITALGGDRVTLPIRAQSVAVNPVDGRLAYAVQTGVLSAFDLWVSDPDGSNPINVTNTPGPSERRPSWSPDGSRIVYQRQEVFQDSEYHVFVMSADGSGVTNLVPEWTGSEPAWSPDGTRIVFRTHRSGSGPGELFTVRPDGTDLTQLTINGNIDANPRWSPDGSLVLFTRLGNSDFDLYLIGADGNGLTRLTDDSRRSTEAGWSPDGRWIVFASRPTNEVFDLFLIRSDGSDEVQLTFGERVGFPVWIP